MKNKILILTLYFFLSNLLLAENNITIESKDISLDKNNQISIFKNEVLITNKKGIKIKSDYAEYNKLTGLIKLKQNINAVDEKGNTINTNYAEYNEKTKIFKTRGKTIVKTSENYMVEGSDIIIDDNNKIMESEKDTLITDLDDNKIFLKNFRYETNLNIFKSIGYVKIEDKKNNIYEFSQIYIDTFKKELVGTDIKSYMNSNDFKLDQENDPRIFANTVTITQNKSYFKKGIFTLCKFRKNDKCPPWTIQSTKMLHDNKKKTIYYNNAIIKVYDIPVFYLPRFSHPDPTVDRRSGFLVPVLQNSRTLGASITIPYFWAVSRDKNLTFTNRLFTSESPLVIGEYKQAFKNATLLSDFGFTGEKNHFFNELVKDFKFTDDSSGELLIISQNVSDDKYLKKYKIISNLVEYDESVLENSINYSYVNEDTFFGFNTSVYETLSVENNDKYEYIYPEIFFHKNLLNDEKFGFLDIQSSYKARKYETNKYSSFLNNNLNWVSNDFYNRYGIKSNILANIKNINYETENIDTFKSSRTSEVFGALGNLIELNLEKKDGDSRHFLTPKILFRYAPDSMRKEDKALKLNPVRAFNLDRLKNPNNFETGLSTTVGLDYKIKKKNESLDFSIAQIINEEENKKFSSESSLDEKVSDLFGSAKYNIKENLDLNYKFAVDQNYSEFNYNQLGAKLYLNPFNIQFDYLHEDKHVGDQEYFNTKINYNNNSNTILSFETKRNIVTDSAEFYNLSYEYLNDCLKAGLVYRREFYEDSEVEPEDSLMFKITLSTFASLEQTASNK